ncbi:uncharacterized protein LOC127723026 [Mytilus californianus]|uniref:uncharacterized protein LOC127723026 n=1 Tax=Mytilus californianus TaxID=6549 RepID=UPI0022451B78|nr:uncharacterized protein LOC127723026 [Mytilus californianus]
MCEQYDINENTTCCAPVCSKLGLNGSCDFQCPLGMHLISSQMYPETCNLSISLINTIKNMCVLSCPKDFVQITIVNTSTCLECDIFCAIDFGFNQLPSNCICLEETTLPTSLFETTELPLQTTSVLYTNTVLKSSALSLTVLIISGSAGLALIVAIVSVFCCFRWRAKFYKLQKTMQVPNKIKLSNTSSNLDHDIEAGNTYTEIQGNTYTPIDSENSEPVNINTTGEDICAYACICDEIKGTENLQNFSNGANGFSVEENRYEELPCRVKTKETQFAQSTQNEYVRTKKKGRHKQQSRQQQKTTADDNKYISVHGLKRQEAKEVVQENSNTLQIPRNDSHLSTAKYESMHVSDKIDINKSPDTAKRQEMGSDFVRNVPQSTTKDQGVGNSLDLSTVTIKSNSTDEEKSNIISQKHTILARNNQTDVYETMDNVKTNAKTTDQSASRMVKNASECNAAAFKEPYHSETLDIPPESVGDLNLRSNSLEDAYSFNFIPFKKTSSNPVGINPPNKRMEKPKDKKFDAFENIFPNTTGNIMPEEQVYENTTIFRKPTCSKTNTKIESTFSNNDNLTVQNKDEKEILIRCHSNGENESEVIKAAAIAECHSNGKSESQVFKTADVAGCQLNGKSESEVFKTADVVGCQLNGKSESVVFKVVAIAGCNSDDEIESENLQAVAIAGCQLNGEMELEDFKTAESRLKHCASFQNKLKQRLEKLNKNGDSESSDEETF